MLHHFLVWRAIHRISKEDVDWQKVGIQILVLLQILMVMPRQGYLIKTPNPRGSFQCAIPMRNIFGFMNDYTKVTYGMQDMLQLIRKDDDDALFHIAAADVEKVKLTKLAWSVQFVQPNDVRKVNMYKSIALNKVIHVCVNVNRSLYPNQHLLYGD